MYGIAGFMMWLIATDAGNLFALVFMAAACWLVWRHDRYG